MNETEGGGCEQRALLSLAGGALDELGGIPLREIDLEPGKKEYITYTYKKEWK